MLCRKGAGKGKGYTENQNTEEGEKEEAGEIFQSAFHATLVFAASFLVQIHGSNQTPLSCWKDGYTWSQKGVPLSVS